MMADIPRLSAVMCRRRLSSVWMNLSQQYARLEGVSKEFGVEPRREQAASILDTASRISDAKTFVSPSESIRLGKPSHIRLENWPASFTMFATLIRGTGFVASTTLGGGRSPVSRAFKKAYALRDGVGNESGDVPCASQTSSTRFTRDRTWFLNRCSCSGLIPACSCDRTSLKALTSPFIRTVTYSCGPTSRVSGFGRQQAPGASHLCLRDRSPQRGRSAPSPIRL